MHIALLLSTGATITSIGVTKSGIFPYFPAAGTGKGSKENTPKVKMLKDETKLFSSCLYLFNDALFLLMLKRVVMRFFENWGTYA